MKLISILIIIFIFTTSASFAQNNDEIVIGKIVKLESKILNEERQIFIHLPDGYDQTNARYPVFYVLDGETHFIHASGTVSFLSVNGVTPQIIIVGIPNTFRNRDFSPTKTDALPGSGGADNFIKFLQEELIPYIDKNYRTESHRILFGHSATGNFSIYTLLSNPDLFNGYIAASPYLMYDNNFVLELAKKDLPSYYSGSKYLYITLGNEPDYFNTIDELTTLLKTKSPAGLEWDYTYMENDNHGSVPLKTIYNGLERIYKGWGLPQGLAKSGDLQSVKDHYNNLSEKYGYEIVIPEAVLNGFGYQVMFQNRIKEAIEIFGYNVELYPNSANVYDSLGEGLEADNQLEEARKNYETAYLKGKDINDPNLNIYKQHLDNVQRKLP
jgi:predicted alpha/beta superfamily hydrolase